MKPTRLLLHHKDRHIEFDFHQHGGKRKSAGRKPKSAEPGMPHRQRARKKRGEPLHITARLADGLPSLRRGGALRIVLAALSASSDRHGMRIVHYSIQKDHLHLLVEADDRTCVARGMNALLRPLARALNKRWGRRGQAFPERYHDEVISTPTQARNALRYVLQNGKKHGVVAISSMDLCSSAPVFDGWMERPSIASISAAPVIAAVAPASTWLLTTGWRRHGLLDIRELPLRDKHATRPRANLAQSSRRPSSR
ncbi:MAG: transposase [Planctomycetes bacterium]|nr:transposase [Planctomycetota bacterium]